MIEEGFEKFQEIKGEFQEIKGEIKDRIKDVKGGDIKA